MTAHKAWRLRIQDENNISSKNTPALSEIKMFRAGTSINVATSSYSTFYASHQSLPVSNAFDGNVNTFWYGSAFQPTQITIGILLTGANEDIDRYSLSLYNSASGNSYAPKDWFLEWSDDTTNGFNGTWTVVDTHTNVTNWTAYEERTFTIPVVFNPELAAIEQSNDEFYAYSPLPPILGNITSQEFYTDNFYAAPKILSHTHWRILVTDDNDVITAFNFCIAELFFYQENDEIDYAEGTIYGTHYPNFFGKPVDQIFDRNIATTTLWGSDTGSPKIVTKQFTSGKAITTIEMIATDNASWLKFMPKNFSIEYADSGSGPWSVLLNVTGETNWLVGEKRKWTVLQPILGLNATEQQTDKSLFFEFPGSHNAWRIRPISFKQGFSAATIQEVEFIRKIDSSDITGPGFLHYFGTIANAENAFDDNISTIVQLNLGDKIGLQIGNNESYEVRVVTITPDSSSFVIDSFALEYSDNTNSNITSGDWVLVRVFDNLSDSWQAGVQRKFDLEVQNIYGDFLYFENQDVFYSKQSVFLTVKEDSKNTVYAVLKGATLSDSDIKIYHFEEFRDEKSISTIKVSLAVDSKTLFNYLIDSGKISLVFNDSIQSVDYDIKIVDSGFVYATKKIIAGQNVNVVDIVNIFSMSYSNKKHEIHCTIDRRLNPGDRVRIFDVDYSINSITLYGLKKMNLSLIEI